MEKWNEGHPRAAVDSPPAGLWARSSHSLPLLKAGPVRASPIREHFSHIFVYSPTIIYNNCFEEMLKKSKNN